MGGNNGNPCDIGMIPGVTIDNVDGKNTVTFTTDAKTTTATDSSAVQYRRISGQFTVPQSTVWTPDAAALKAGVKPSVPFVAGSQGPLYLNTTGISLQGSSALGAVYIRGSVSPFLDDEYPIRFKYPNCGGVDPFGPMKLALSALPITCYADGQTPSASTINLCDPTLATPGQSLQWSSDGPLALQLTQAGCAILNVAYQAGQAVNVWPLSINIAGAPPPAEGGYASSVDLRDQSYAWPVQSEIVNTVGATVVLTLSDTGMALFGYASDDARKAAQLVAGLPSASLDAIETLWNTQRAMDTWPTRAINLPDNANTTPVKALLRRLNGHRR